jgi:glycerol-3-phosphate acyltransferase PlsY
MTGAEALLAPAGLAALAAAMALGYLLGSIPFGLVLTRAAGLGDIRAVGSGNIGATNVLRTGRRDLALATLALDAGKAGLAFLACRSAAAAAFSPEPAFVVALGGGAAAFVGHCFPVWLGFKGGKGVATYVGLLVAAMWPVGLTYCAVWLAMAAAFRMSSLAALTAALAAPFLAAVHGYGPAAVGVSSGLALLLFWRHRANIARIANGTEPRIGARKPANPAEPVSPSPPETAP